MSEKIGFDCPKVTQDEAVKLCVYHLRMAAGLYQATPEDPTRLDEEINRVCEDEAEKLPALAFSRVIFKVYEDMKKRD